MITPQHDALTSHTVHLYAQGTLRHVSEVKNVLIKKTKPLYLDYFDLKLQALLWNVINYLTVGWCNIPDKLNLHQTKNWRLLSSDILHCILWHATTFLRNVLSPYFTLTVKTAI